MSNKPARLDIEGPVAFITLNRPERRNALTLQMLNIIREFLVRIGEDTNVRVGVIRAEGTVFCSGHDLKELQKADEKGRRDIFETCSQVMSDIRHLPQPVVVQVRGLATAAGCQMVAACDLALASEGAAFAVPGVKIGFFCTTPMVPLSRSVGRKKALEMLLTGQAISAAAARQYGLVNKVVPDEDLEKETIALALLLSGYSRKVLSEGKKNFYFQMEMEEDEAYRRATRAMIENASRPEAKEGISAFLEKRPPSWDG